MKSLSRMIWLLLPWFLLIITGILFWLFYQKIQTETVQQYKWVPPREAVTADKIKPNMVDSYSSAVNSASLSVVNIFTTQKVDKRPYEDDPFMKRFFEFQEGNPQKENNTNLGSGVVVSDDGYIVTNSHVIAEAEDIIIAFNDGKKAKAKLIGADPESDLAVIKVDMKGLKPLPFKVKSSDVGDVVLAIGNPFGVGQTVTQGIISATGRSGLGINTFEDFIQTDAAINPGNSGGALVDAYGHLVGINTAIFSRSGGNMGIGFAIPTQLVEQVMNAIIKDGKVTRGWLGIEVRANADNPAAITSKRGVEVMRVIKDGPAEKSGLLKGDIIISLNGVEMNNPNDLIKYVARQAPENILNAEISRGKDKKQLAVTLSTRPAQASLIEDNRQFLDKKDLPKNKGNQGQKPPKGSKDTKPSQIPEELLEFFKH